MGQVTAGVGPLAGCWIGARPRTEPSTPAVFRQGHQPSTDQTSAQSDFARPQRSKLLPSAGPPTCGTAFWDQRPVASKGDGMSLPELNGTTIPGKNANSGVHRTPARQTLAISGPTDLRHGASWDQRPVISKGDGMSLPELNGTSIPGQNANSGVHKTPAQQRLAISGFTDLRHGVLGSAACHFQR